jgi:Cytochrome P450
MERLRREVLSVVSDAAHPTREQIRRMPYLANVIKESLDIDSHQSAKAC